jgi:hypothetical protein
MTPSCAPAARLGRPLAGRKARFRPALGQVAGGCASRASSDEKAWGLETRRRLQEPLGSTITGGGGWTRCPGAAPKARAVFAKVMGEQHRE